MAPAATGGNCANECKNETNRRSFAMASELVKFVNVSGHQLKIIGEVKEKKNDANAKHNKTEHTATSASPSIRVLTPLEAIGENKYESTDNDRPGWSATNRDMTKDLMKQKSILSKVNVAEAHSRPLAKQLTSLPFHAVLVKWRMSFNFPVYTPRIVHGILSRFGEIDSMGTLSHNSMFVVFHHEYHACRAITSRSVGFSYCPLICRWWYLNRYKHPITDPADVKREDLLVSDGRLERNCKRHIAQIKREFWRKAAALSYDVSSFQP